MADKLIKSIQKEIKLLGTRQHRSIGSSVFDGYSYHPIPFKEFSHIPFHRQSSGQRAKILFNNIDIRGKRVLDLGSATGYFSMLSLKYAAKEAIGIEGDRVACSIANKLAKYYKLNGTFYNQKITVKNIEKLGKFDVCIFFSTFQWVVKALGFEESYKVINTISKNCKTLFFETAEGQDGAAKLKVERGWALKVLQKYTKYNDIYEIGSTAGYGKLPRKIYICSTDLSRPKITPYKQGSRSTIYKWETKDSKFAIKVSDKPELKQEYGNLRKLCGLGFPTVVAYGPYKSNKRLNYIKMEFLDGPRLDEAIDKTKKKLYGNTKYQKAFLLRALQILRVLEKQSLVHRDLHPKNIILCKGLPVVFDPEWIIDKKKALIGPNPGGLGMSYKAPEGPVSDVYSMGKMLSNLFPKTKYRDLFKAMTSRKPQRVESVFKLLRIAKLDDIFIEPDITELPENISNMPLVTDHHFNLRHSTPTAIAITKDTNFDKKTYYHSFKELGYDNPQNPHKSFKLNQNNKSKYLLPYIKKAIDLNGGSGTFLDAGCASGFYGFYALRNKATKVLFNDVRSHYEQQIDYFAKKLHIAKKQYSFSSENVEQEQGTYNIVLAAGLLYITHDPEYMLEQLWRLTKNYLIIQSVYTLDYTYSTYCEPITDKECRFSISYIDELISGLKKAIVIDRDKNFLTGNDLRRDKGSIYYLIKKERLKRAKTICKRHQDFI